MEARRGLAPTSLAIAVSVIVASCGVSSSFLSDSERSSLYSIQLNSLNGNEIENGSILAAGSDIIPTISRLPGASYPEALDIEIEGAAGRKALRTRYRSADPSAGEQASFAQADGAGASQAGIQAVDAIEGALPGIALPASLRPGAYRIAMKVLGKDGSIDLKSQRIVFIGVPAPLIETATSFPPSIEPGAPALLGISIGYAMDAPGDPESIQSADPWIEWSADGSPFAAGLLSAGFDKTVWTAPGAPGAYSVAVQVYPAAPLDAEPFGFPAAAESRRKVSVMAIANPAGSGDDFADSLSFLSLLRLDGDFSDAGTRPRTAHPGAFGSPALDVYPTGFGYRLGADSGVWIPGLMPPGQGDRLSAFSVLVRVAPEDGEGTGTIVRFRSDDGSYSLVIGLEKWKPYAEFSFDGKIQRSAAPDAIPASPLTLQGSFSPSGDRLEIRWYAEGEPLAAPSMPLPPPPGAGSATLGGALSLAGVYDGFGLSAGAPPPAYRLAARRKWKSSLIYAEGFEDGKPPAPSAAGGGAAASPGAIALERGASLSLVPSFEPGDGVAIEATLIGDRASARLVFSEPGGAALFSVRGSGEVEDATGAVLGALDLGPERATLSISASEGGFSLLSGDRGGVFVPSTASALQLSLARAEGGGALSVGRVLVRQSPAPKAE